MQESKKEGSAEEGRSGKERCRKRGESCRRKLTLHVGVQRSHGDGSLVVTITVARLAHVLSRVSFRGRVYLDVTSHFILLMSPLCHLALYSGLDENCIL